MKIQTYDNQLLTLMTTTLKFSHYPISVRVLLLTSLFILFLIPLSFEIRGDHVSGNYIFIFYPLLAILFAGKFQKPDKTALNIAIIYILIFLITSLYQFSNYQFLDRRLVSFIIFMSAFVFLPIRIDRDMVKAFKFAIVSISLYYSIDTLTLFLSLINSNVGYEIKGVVGSQRFGFVLAIAGWIVVFFKPQKIFDFVFKYLLLFILLCGLALTFSRSSIAGLLGSLGLYTCNIGYQWLKNPRNPTVRQMKLLIANLIAAISVLYLCYLTIPMTFAFYFSRILDLNITPIVNGFFSFSKYPIFDTYVYNVFESSEGFRLFMIGKVFEYLSSNPLFGSGYLGVWSMFDDLQGSAHNQFLDVLFRTGVIGFTLFMFILIKILSFLFKQKELGLLFGIIGVLFIGFFHETFKLSQGAFIFAFLVGMTFQTGIIQNKK